MKKVKHILEQKGNLIHTITPDLTVYEAIRVMGEQNVGSVLVVVDGQLVGILTERDYARKVVLKGKYSATTFVHEIMTPHPGLHIVSPETTVETCMEVMTEKKIRHLPVMQNDQLLGVVSIGDVMSILISQQQGIIEHMTNYLYRR